MDFQRETLFDVIEEVQPLLEAHHLEIRQTANLAPRWPLYAQLERMGCYVVLTAREGAELVGYAGFFIQPHMHDAGLMYAHNDALYIKPEHRRGTTALRFIDFAQTELKAAGAQKIGYAVPTSHDWRPILHRKGYTDDEIVCGKELRS